MLPVPIPARCWNDVTLGVSRVENQGCVCGRPDPGADLRRGGGQRPIECAAGRPTRRRAGPDARPGGSDAATAAAEAGGQPDVAAAAEAEPGSGEGLTIGYLSNLESVPIVHVISEGIREQAEIAGSTSCSATATATTPRVSTACECSGIRAPRESSTSSTMSKRRRACARPAPRRPSSPSTFLSLRARPPSWASTTPTAAHRR